MVIVSQYKPNVQCFGSLNMAQNAGERLLDVLPFDWWDTELFGRVGTKGVRMVVPKVYSRLASRKSYHWSLEAIFHRIQTKSPLATAFLQATINLISGGPSAASGR